MNQLIEYNQKIEFSGTIESHQNVLYNILINMVVNMAHKIIPNAAMHLTYITITAYQ